MLTVIILLLGLFRSDNDAQTNKRDVFLISYLTLSLLSRDSPAPLIIAITTLDTTQLVFIN